MKLFLALIGLIVSCIFWGSIYAASAGTMPDHDYMNEIKEIHEQAAVNAQSKGLNVMNEYFARGNEGIYVINPEKTDWILFTEADPETFEIISGRFAKDHDSIFSGFHILRGIDRDTFAVVSGEHGYAADTNRVYGPEFVVDKADPETFRMFNRNYAQDIARVFFRGRELG